ncbi:DUF484 family protein [Pseudooctadecabacter jejudonensis]|uniref:Recombinase XerC n=1 Tax=Pseudooctadecabacter jejudonensis TaxID=1391910 RepID=A0A1Y5SW77_9RHOB|nr:DUF484 family protein [Pseudooctadecabacter jejudonensis]SLN50100.1 hypothetical protein PSJ8397_02608 [Pseudooctadecabacter jejudonensis]
MSSDPLLTDDVRSKIMSDPQALLEDQDIMRALVTANDDTRGGNIVDLRGIAMDRLEARLDRLEDTHRNVIAAAYENLAGTNQIHRAILRMMDATRFEPFLRDLRGEVADILRVDVVRLILESSSSDPDPTVAQLSDILSVAEPGFVQDYISMGRSAPARQVTLRQVTAEDEEIFGEKAPYIRSEACLRLDLGVGRLPGMLILGAEDPHQFTPQQGTDLLTFFAGVLERSLRRWLS